MVAIEGRSTGTAPRTARRRLAARVVWIVAVAGLAGVVALAWVYVAEIKTVTPLDLLAGLAILTSLGAFILSGALIVSRQPENVIGWLLIVPGLVLPVSELATRYLASLEPPPTTMSPGLWVLLWATSWSWALLIFPIFHILLTFPAGRLLSPRWRWAVVLEVVMIATVFVLAGLVEAMGPLINDEHVWTVENPVGLLPLDLMGSAFGTIWGVALVAITVLSAAAPMLRFRRGSAEEREQLKWPLMAAFVFGAIYGLGVIEVGAAVEAGVEALLGFGLAAIPISVAIAVTRYHLYEIDLLIGRTVMYGLISALLAVTFIGTNVALQSLLLPGTTFEVAASTLVVAILFQPLRHAIQRPIDRRFNRARVDAEQLVAAFAARTRDEVDLARLVGETRRVAIGAVQPRVTGLWLRSTPR